MIRNGDFAALKKDGVPSDWYLPRDAALKACVTLDEGIFRTTGRSLKIENANESICAMQLLPDLKPNTTYLLTFFVKTENIIPMKNSKGAFGAVVNIFTSHNEWFPQNWYKGTMPWTKQGFVFKTDGNVSKTKKSYIRLRFDHADGTVWFDDVRLREIKGD